MPEPIITTKVAVTVAQKISPAVGKYLGSKLPIYKIMHQLGFDPKNREFKNIYNQAVVAMEEIGKPSELITLLKKDIVYDCFCSELYKMDDQTVLNEFNALIGIDPKLSFLQGDVIENEVNEFRLLLASYIQQSRSPKEALLANDVSELTRMTRDIHQKLMVAPDTLHIAEAQLSQITGLRAQNQHHALIKLLTDFKNKEWENLSPELRFKVQLNLGLAYFELSQYVEAAACLTDLPNYNYKKDEALGFAALGYSIIDKFDEARIAAREAIKENPNNGNAYIALLQCETDISTSRIDELIPATIQQIPVLALNIGAALQRAGKPQEGLVYLEKAMSTLSSDDPLRFDLLVALANGLLDPYAGPANLDLQYLDTSGMANVEKAIEYYTEAWQYYKNTDLRETKWHILLNRGTAFRCLGKLGDAEKDYQMALDIKEHYVIYRNLSLLAGITGKDPAIYFKKMKALANGIDEQLDVALGEVIEWARRGQFKPIIEQIGILSSFPSVETELKFRFFQIDALLQNAQIPEATSIADDLVGKHPNLSIPYFFKAMIAEATQDSSAALSWMEQAMQFLGTLDRQSFLSYYADLLTRHGNHAAVITLFDNEDTTTTYSEQTKKLLEALSRSGNHSRIEKIIRALGKKVESVSFLTDMLSYVQEVNGNLDQALETVVAYRKTHPEDILMKMKEAFLLFKIESYLQGIQLIEQIPVTERDKLPLVHRFMIADAFVLAGQVDKGFEYAYHLRKSHLADIKAHEQYLYFITRRNRMGEHFPMPDIIGEECFITLKDLAGSPEEIIITAKPDAIKEISPSSPIATALLGKKVGDIVDWGKGEKEIAAILTKYTYAFQESMDQLSRRALENETSIKSFSLIQSENHKEKFKPLFDVIDSGSAWDEQVDNLYQGRLATIGAIASASHMNPIQYWGRLVQKPQIGIQATQQGQDAHEGFGWLMIGSDVILDITAILTLHSLDAFPYLDQIPNKLYTTQSVVDLIDDEIAAQSIDLDRETLSVAKINNQYVRIITSPEEKQARLKKLTELKGHVIKYLTIVTPEYPTNAPEKEALDKLLGKSFNEAAIVAKDRKILLYSDDCLFLELAHNSDGTKGISTVPFLHYLKNCDLIDTQKQSELHARLIQLSYKSIPVTGTVLYDVFDRTRFVVDYPFINACDKLYTLEHRFCASVITEFLYKVYANSLLLDRREFVCQYMIKIYFGSRPGPDAQNIFLALLKSRFHLMPLQLERVIGIINAFSQAKT